LGPLGSIGQFGKWVNVGLIPYMVASIIVFQVFELSQSLSCK
jgi:hypothetical protein